jgi:hypothetical protein
MRRIEPSEEKPTLDTSRVSKNARSLLPAVYRLKTHSFRTQRVRSIMLGSLTSNCIESFILQRHIEFDEINTGTDQSALLQCPVIAAA